MHVLKTTLFLMFLLGLTGSLRAAEELDAILAEIPSSEGAAVVWLTGNDRREQLWVVDLIGDAHWRRSIPEPTRILTAEEQQTVAVRFGVRQYPVCLLLAADGTEVGRLQATDNVAEFHRQLGKRLQAARVFLRHRNAPLQTSADGSNAYWLGLFHWQRGERFKARRWFDRFLAQDPLNHERGREQYAHVLYLRGEHAMDCGRPHKATLLFEKARRTSGDRLQTARYLLAEARALQRSGRTDEALDRLSRQLAQTDAPASGLEDRLLFTLAYLQLEHGQSTKAQAAFVALITTFPASRYAHRARHHLQVTQLLPTANAETDEPTTSDAPESNVIDHHLSHGTKPPVEPTDSTALRRAVWLRRR